MRALKRGIIDLSSVLKRCYFAGKDIEFGYKLAHEGKEVYVNGWQHGRESFMNYMSAALRDLDLAPTELIFVLEGKDGAAIRRNIYFGYKKREPRPQAQLDEYNTLEAWVQEYFKRLGSIFVKQDRLEADDVVKYLAKNLSCRKVVLADDGDMLELVADDCLVYYQSKLHSGQDNPLGPFPVEFNNLYKAIVGDKSDTLPGATGVGPKGFIDLYVACEEDGLRDLQRIIKAGTWKELEEDAKHFKPLAKILESSDIVRRCFIAAGSLDHLVNTVGKRPVWTPGIVLEKPEGEPADARFDKWYQQRRIIHSGNFAELMASGVFSQIKKSPWVTIDLETATPPESDDWLREVNRQDEDDAPKGVDVIASKIAGMGVTFGDNQQHTLYFTVDHKTDKNITVHQLYLFLTKMIECDADMRFVVHNNSFEQTVFYLNMMEWTRDNPSWDNGFLPRVDDTLFMASYVDENKKIGLKAQALNVLGYEQVSYEEVTQGRKMNAMTPQEVFHYGTDDTIVTAALRNYYDVILDLEKTFNIYRDVEIDAAYLVAAGAVKGVKFNLETMRKQEQEDDKLYDAAWTTLRAYLIAQKWTGVEMPEVTLEAASMKAIFQIVTGAEFKSQTRTVSKLIPLMRDWAASEDLDDGYTLSTLYQWALDNNGDTSKVEAFARKFFKGEPDLNTDSPKQMTDLLYETMKLPIRVRNRATEKNRADNGRKAEGSPKSDALAIASAKFYDSETHSEAVAVLDALHTMRSVSTRRKLYYRPYRSLRHWQTRMIHGSMGQCMTVTRRFAPNKPNLAQLPKTKGDFRMCFEPHHKDAVVVSPDFSAQELRVIADSSGDEAMTSCFVGDNLRDMHCLTGVGIAKKKGYPDMTYEEFSFGVKPENEHPLFSVLKAFRGKAKTTNFSSEYGAQAPKMATVLMVPEEEAQSYLDAKFAMFWRAEEWKKEDVIPLAKSRGYAVTRLGARRHLEEAFASDSWSIRSGAERQAVNFEIQGSCGEMTKLAMGRVWRSGLLNRYDAVFMMPVHDELVFSVARRDCVAFTKELHAIMAMPYADMHIPIKSSIGIGHNFKELVEIGEEATTEALVGALVKLFPEHSANEYDLMVAA